MEMIAGITAFAFVIAAILAIISLIAPGTAFFLKAENRTRQKALLSYSGIALVFFIVYGLTASASPKKTDAPPDKTATVHRGTALPWKEIEKEKNVRAQTGRDRLEVTIVPLGDQSRATRDDLLATVKEAAERYQKESGLPLVSITLLCQQTKPFRALQLAHAVYIPDQKGYDGRQNTGPWDMVRAAGRGFTDKELEYLRLWGEMRAGFQKDGRTDEDALDAAVSGKMGIKTGTLNPHLNMPENAEMPRP